MSDSKLWLWIWKLREFWARDQFGCQHWQRGLNMIVQGEVRKGRERPKMECWSEEKKSLMVQDGMVSEMEGKPEKQSRVKTISGE